MLSMNGDYLKSVKRKMRQWIKMTGKLILCPLVYPQLVIGTLSLMVSMRKTIKVVVLLAIQMARIVQLQCKGWRDDSGALPLNLRKILSKPSWLPGRMQITKLIDKLKRKEANIDDWQKSKITLARNEMTKTEMKLEKKRAEAVQKMQKAIKQAQKKADNKKIKEQAATANQIAGVERALVKMSRTGKLPWSLAFL